MVNIHACYRLTVDPHSLKIKIKIKIKIKKDTITAYTITHTYSIVRKRNFNYVFEISHFNRLNIQKSLKTD